MVIHVNFQRRSPGGGEKLTKIALWTVSDPAQIPEVGQTILLESEEGNTREYRVVERSPVDLLSGFWGGAGGGESVFNVYLVVTGEKTEGRSLD